MSLNWPLMNNNILQEDLDQVISFLQTNPILTQSAQVRAFEEEWSKWVGVKYSVFVNSGSSANFLTVGALKYLKGSGDILVPSLTWVSDIVSVLNFGFRPVFVDVDPTNLAMSMKQIREKYTPETKAIFLTHVLGFNGLSDELIAFAKEKDIVLIEDVCESHGATFNGKRLGSFGWASNFSFYYAHHLSTIEGGMVCTNSEEVYEIVRMMRSHGMVREATSAELKTQFINENPDLNPEFIFAYPGFNMRSTEINAVIGRKQLTRLDANNEQRFENFKRFLDKLDDTKYRTDFNIEGSVNYAFVLILKDANDDFVKKVMELLREQKVEFRRGTAGGGNQIRQPYLKSFGIHENPAEYPEVEHIHRYGFYIGNFPDLEKEKIDELCSLLNGIV